MGTTKTVIIVGLVLVALYLLHRLARWMEDRGWIYYTRKKPDPASLGSAFLELHQIVQPDKKHILTVKRESRVEQKGEAEPKDPGRRGAGPRAKRS
jgi:hypothetical protein